MAIVKYLRYLGIGLWKIAAKLVIYVGLLLVILGMFNTTCLIIGASLLLWMVVAYKTRHWSTSIVFSYTLQNGLYLPRLTNDKKVSVVPVENGWELHSSKYKTIGFVEDKKVNWLTYQLVFWLLWGWTDNDCDRDTVAIGYGRDILEGKHFPGAPVWFLKRIAKEQAYLETQPDGNAFHLGNTLVKNWVPILSTMWMFRNLAYNFNYSLEELPKGSKWHFYIHFPSKGWHFGFIPYDAKERHGRMVWFTEDYANIY